jgi:thiol-disulfide isomerase/thioredoxin
LRVIYIFVVLLTIFGCESRNDNKKIEDFNQSIEEPNSIVENKELILKDIYSNEYIVDKSEEKRIKLSGIENKAILFEFFATWCEPCIGLISHLNSMKNNFDGELEIVAVLLEDGVSNKEMIEFARDRDIKYIILNSEANEELLRLNGNIKVIPYMVLYDKNGNFFTNYFGSIPEEMMTQDIKRMLKR